MFKLQDKLLLQVLHKIYLKAEKSKTEKVKLNSSALNRLLKLNTGFDTEEESKMFVYYFRSMKGIYHLLDLFNINYDKQKQEYVCSITFALKGLNTNTPSFLKMYNKRKVFKPKFSSRVLYPKYEPGVSRTLG